MNNNKTSWARSRHDETDGEDFVYRHTAAMIHPCEFACNSFHPLNKANKVKKKGRRWIIVTEKP